jgi:hypothetical protein
MTPDKSTNIEEIDRIVHMSQRQITVGNAFASILNALKSLCAKEKL